MLESQWCRYSIFLWVNRVRTAGRDPTAIRTTLRNCDMPDCQPMRTQQRCYSNTCSLWISRMQRWLHCKLWSECALTRFTAIICEMISVPSPRGALVGLAPLNKAPSLPNWNVKHNKSVHFLSNMNVKSPMHKRKAPYSRLSGDGSGWDTDRNTPFPKRVSLESQASVLCK